MPRPSACLVVAALAVALGVAFGGPAAPAAAQAPPPIQVEINDAQVEFGAEIRFRLRARSGDGEDPIRSVLLLYQVDDSVVQNTGGPAYQPGPVVSAAYSWRVANVLVPGSEVRYQWQLETAGGIKTTTAEQSVTYNDTRFTWREARGDKLTVYWHTADPQTGATLLEEAAKIHGKLSREFGLSLERPVRIFAYSRQQDYVSALATGQPLDIATTVGLDRIFVLAAGGAAGNPSGMTPAMQGLRREMANAVFLQQTHNPFADPPRWLAEGFGLFMSGEEISAQNYRALAQFAQANRLLPLKTLNGNFPNGDQDRTLAYVESLAVVKYIVDTYGPDKLRATLAAFKEGNTVDDALKKGLGVTLDQLESRWKAALGRGAAGQPAQQRPGAAPAGDGGFADRVFGPAIRFWQGVFGPHAETVTLGLAGFIGLAIVAVIGGSIYSLWRRGRDEDV
jgi:hypothetical protein